MRNRGRIGVWRRDVWNKGKEKGKREAEEESERGKVTTRYGWTVARTVVRGGDELQMLAAARNAVRL